jgi:hypothetical protein
MLTVTQKETAGRRPWPPVEVLEVALQDPLVVSAGICGVVCDMPSCVLLRSFAVC